jgi:hypothetical protein
MFGGAFSASGTVRHGLSNALRCQEMANISVTVSAYNANAPYSSADTVTLADTGANIAALSSGAFADLAANGIDKINATDNVLSLTVAKYQALSDVTLAAGDVITLADSGANLAALSATDIAALADAGIDRIDATDNALTLTVAQYQALGTVALTAADTITLTGTGATLSALSAAEIGALSAAGVDQLDASNNILSLTLAQYQALGSVTVAANDVLTLSGTGASIGALSVAQIAGLAAAGFDKVNATDNVLTLTVAQYQALGTVELVAGDVITLADTGTHIAALSAQDFAALADAGIDRIDATDNVLNLTVDQFLGLGTVELATGDLVTLADSGANIAALSAADLATLGSMGVDALDATDNALSLTVEQAQALGSVTLAAADVVTLADTGANLAALNPAELAQLASAGFDAIDASDGALTLSLAQITALGTVMLTPADTVIAQATVAEIADLSPNQIAALADAGVDLIGASDGEPAVSVAQAQAIVDAGLWFTGQAAVLADSGAAIQALTGTALEDIYLHGITSIDATDDVLTLSVDQIVAVEDAGTALTGADLVTLADAGSTLGNLSANAIDALVQLGVDHIDATDNALTLSVAQLQALDTITLTGADTVTLTDTGANLAALSAAEIAALAGLGVDAIHATDDAPALTVAQAQALGAVALTAADTVTVADSAAHIEALSANEIAALATAGIDAIDSSDNALSLTLEQAQALGGIMLAGGIAVTLTGTGAQIAALAPADLAALVSAGIDAVDASDDALALSVAQADALATVTLSGTDALWLVDTGAHLAALSPADLASLAARGFATIDATDNTLTLSLAQAQGLAGLALTGADMVTVEATGTQFAALTAQDFADLAALGVDALSTTDHALSLSVAQIEALGGLSLSAADTITLADTSATLKALSAGDLASLVALGVDQISTTTGSLVLIAEQALALDGAVLADGTELTVMNDGATLAALSPAQWAVLAAIGTGTVDVTDNALTLDIAQFQALGGLAFGADDSLSVEDTAANIGGLTTADIAAMIALGVTHLTVDDAALPFSVAQLQALGTITVASPDGIVLTDSGDTLSGLSVSQWNAAIDAGVVEIKVTAGTLSLSLDQFDAINNGATIDPTASATLTVSAQEMAQLDATDIAYFGAHGIDVLAGADGTLSLTLPQLGALGSLSLVEADTVSLTLSNADLADLSPADLQDLAALGIDVLDLGSDAATITLAQAAALGDLTISATPITLADAADAVGALSATALAGLADLGVSVIDASGDALVLDTQQASALHAAGITLEDGNGVMLADSASALAALSASQIAALADDGYTMVEATDAPLTLTPAQALALGSVVLTDNQPTTVAASGSVLGALSASDLAQIFDAGVDRIDATDNALTLTLAQLTALGDIALSADDMVTLSITGSDLSALATDALQSLVDVGISQVSLSSGTAALSLAQLQALHGLHFAADAGVTLVISGAALGDLSLVDIAALRDTGLTGLSVTGHDATLSVTQADALDGLGWDELARVTLADTGGAITSALSTYLDGSHQLPLAGIDASDNALSLSLAQLDALNGVTIAANDVITLLDSDAHIAALDRDAIDALSARGVSVIAATDGHLALGVETWSRIVQDDITFDGATHVVVTDSGATLAQLAEETLAQFADSGVTRIDASDDTLVLSYTQFQALGSVALTAQDTVKVWFNGDTLASLSVDDIAALAQAGVDMVSTMGDTLYVDLATLGHLAEGGLALDESVPVRLVASGADLAALAPEDLAALVDQGVDVVQVTDSLTLSVAQFAALDGVAFHAMDTMTVADTGAHLAALSEDALAALADAGVTVIDATDGSVQFTLGQLEAMGSIYVAWQDQAIVGLTAQQAADLNNETRAELGLHGIDAIAITQGTLTLGLSDLARYNDYAFVGGDVVLAASGTTLGGLMPADFSDFAARGITAIDATDDALVLTLTQFAALGTVHLTASDDVTIVATAADLASLSPAVYAAMSASGVDNVEVSGGALQLNAAQAAELGNVQLLSSAPITLVDSGANIAALSIDAIAGLAGSGITGIDATTGITINATRYEALGGIHFALSDVVTVASNHSFAMGADVDNVTLSGNKNLVVTGNGGANVITGNAGRNTLDGGAGNDRLIGGAGRDVLTGGAGTDKFIFRDGDFGGNTASTADRITDFSHGSRDLISLIGVDANANTVGDDAFSWIGTSAFHHVAGELRFAQAGGNTFVQGDTNGDGLSDFWIRLDGLVNLQASDFQL